VLISNFDRDTRWFSSVIQVIIEKNTETLIDVSKEIGPEVSVEKPNYMLLSRYQNDGQNYNMKRANRSFENVSQFKYL
jgi:hypothetical protein